MIATIKTPPRESGPAWEIARLFPDQGYWGEGDYLALNRLTNRLVEFVDGRIEVLEMPTITHQRIISRLHNALETFVTPRGLGEAVFAPYPVRISPKRFREPDVVFALAEHADWLTEDFAERADLVMEVVSEDRNRDLVEKRRDYVRAGIAEYWIVDPKERRITVLKLTGRGKRYVLHGEYDVGETAESALLEGFEVPVGRIIAGDKGK